MTCKLSLGYVIRFAASLKSFLVAMNKLSMSGAIVLSLSYDIILHLVNQMLSVIFTNIGEYRGSHIVSCFAFARSNPVLFFQDRLLVSAKEFFSR